MTPKKAFRFFQILFNHPKHHFFSNKNRVTKLWHKDQNPRRQFSPICPTSLRHRNPCWFDDSLVTTESPTSWWNPTNAQCYHSDNFPLETKTTWVKQCNLCHYATLSHVHQARHQLLHKLRGLLAHSIQENIEDKVPDMTDALDGNELENYTNSKEGQRAVQTCLIKCQTSTQHILHDMT